MQTNNNKNCQRKIKRRKKCICNLWTLDWYTHWFIVRHVFEPPMNTKSIYVSATPSFCYCNWYWCNWAFCLLLVWLDWMISLAFPHFDYRLYIVILNGGNVSFSLTFKILKLIGFIGSGDKVGTINIICPMKHCESRDQ